MDTFGKRSPFKMEEKELMSLIQRSEQNCKNEVFEKLTELKTELDKKIKVLKTELDKKISAVETKTSVLETKIHALKTELKNTKKP